MKTCKKGQKIKQTISVARNQYLSLTDKLAKYDFKDTTEKVEEIQAAVSQRHKDETDPATLGPILIELEAIKGERVDKVGNTSKAEGNPTSEPAEDSFADEISSIQQIITKGK